MPEIIIPERLVERLGKDTKKQASVTNLQSKVQEIISESPYFFPDYTDHGIDHINEVLIMADQLIAEDTYSAKNGAQYLLNPNSVAFLICAILLHDLGMFLKTDGVKMLVAGECSSHRIDGLDANDWRTCWSEYVTKTRRMKDNEMDHLFGHSVSISDECVLKGSSTTEDDRRIIGEFLRQNHGRLAHEIAVHGFPGTQLEDLFEKTNFLKKDRDMIGLLARSHQMNIRDTEVYLRTFNRGPMPHGIPAFYLMAVLRMADYLDASDKRAPEILERIQKIRVPASETEWAWNQCITEAPRNCDPETHNLQINAEPVKSSEYVLLDKWLRSVQAELDLCWSILAEHYSTKPYRLTIHRILSNIHEEDARNRFNEDFLTKEAKISANPAIVKLMMEPLYGDDPTYGVRELLQNAVDACLEREKWEKDHGNPNYKGLVDIRIENDVFTITDNGMGMNEDVLLNYYLSAGSSYRSSDAWMAANAPDGKSQVARTGRFGVGFLASFLLGDEVEVFTKHREDEKGYHFTFSQESSPLDIQCADRTNPYAAEVNDPTHAGTTITIRLKESAIDGFNSKVCQYPLHSWYAFDEPKVRYFYYGAELHHQGLSLHRDPTKNGDWLTLPTKDFALYQWKPNISISNSEFYCNGIRIYTNYINLSKDELYHPLPHVSITDKNGNLDVKLSRNALRTFPLARELYRELYRLYIAQLLLTPWDSEEHYQQNCTSGFNFFGGHPSNTPFLLSKRGFTLNHACVIPLLELKDYVILCIEKANTRNKIQNALDALQQDTPFSIISHDQNLGTTGVPSFNWRNPVPFFEKLLLGRNQMFGDHSIRYSLYNCCDSLWIHKDFEFLMSHFPPEIQNNMTEFEEIYDIHLIDLHSEVPIDRSKFQTSDFIAAIHLVNNFEFHRLDCSQFTQTLREVLVPEPDYPDQDIWIPFDMDERKKKFRTVFEDLSGYMEYINNYPIE